MTTMHVVPCLYNSFSFTPENIMESMVFYDVSTFKEKAIPVYAGPTIEPEPSESSSSESSSSSSESSSDSESSSGSSSDSGSSSSTSSPECNDIVTNPFHPDIMAKFAVSPSGPATDSLLWISYIIINGPEKFETVENHYTESNRFKFELVELVRKHKPILKANKLKISGLEESLVHKPFINLETLEAVALCKNISVCIVQGRKYYEVGGGGGAPPFIIEKIKGKYVLYDSPPRTNTDYLNYIRKNYWLMESISTPIRPMSAYKLQDLMDISVKLNLPIANRIPGKFGSMGTEKRKTKPELYEAICKYV